MQIRKSALFNKLGYQPHPGQQAVHSSTARHRVLACGVRWGKSRCAAMEAIAAALEPRERSVGWVVAPTLDLSEKVFREIAFGLSTHMAHRVVAARLHEKRLLVRNLGGGVSEIRAKTADNPVSLLGEGLDWVVVDEAARLKAEIWHSFLSQRLIDKQGWALLISTPKGKGWFYDMWRRGQRKEPAYESWNSPSWENPNLDSSVVQAQRGQVPERVFLQEYGAEFLEGDGQVFRNVRECATGELAPPVLGAQYFAGLDLAKVEDFSVVCILDSSRRLVAFDRFRRLDWGLQVARVRSMLERYNDAQVLVDSTGVGEPVYESLRREGCRAKPYVLTSRSKAHLVDSLTIMFERREISLPRYEVLPELIDELESYEYSVTDSGLVRTEAVSGSHDDCVMSLALAAYELGPSRANRVVNILPILGA